MANELILVVEDNDKNRKLVRDVLTFKGYEIIVMTSSNFVGSSPSFSVMLEEPVDGCDKVFVAAESAS